MEDGIGRVLREKPFSFQYVMDMWLGHTGEARQSALGDLAASDAGAQVRDKPLMQLLKIHHFGTYRLFL